MSTITINQKVPELSFKITGDKVCSFNDYAGNSLILYFYPKDNTPGCSIEAADFRNNYAKFQQTGINILGVSRDSLTSHNKFRTKKELPFDLISDSESELCQAFDVIKDKSLFGKKYKAIERSTFLIDEQGIVREIWRKVKVRGHVNEVLKKASELST